MTKAESIRSLGREGLPVAEVARRVGVRYQHAYKVLRDANLLTAREGRSDQAVGASSTRLPSPRPWLTAGILQAGGFAHSANWILDAGSLKPSQELPRTRGVYAFVKDELALYVGVATMGLAKRLYFYGRPGATQRTSLRIGAAIRAELEAGAAIQIFTASPPDFDWNGLPVAGDAGLELGLIGGFKLPWNMRGT